MLTLDQLRAMKPDTIFAQGFTAIEHPWFNHATRSLIEGTRNTLVKWVAIRGGVYDWAIYHSLDANLCPDDYLDGLEHLEASAETVARAGAKLHDIDKVRELVPCDDEALEMYRH